MIPPGSRAGAPLCKDCRWLGSTYAARQGDPLCMHPQCVYRFTSLLTGEVETGHLTWHEARAFRDQCGNEGRYWESRGSEHGA